MTPPSGLPAHIADTYCKYLALETKHSRSKQQDNELDRYTEVLSHTYQNPRVHLPVRPIDAEEALAVTGIVAYVPPRQELTPYRTERLCQPLAGNSFHPNLILATLGGEGNLQQFTSGTRCHECADPPPEHSRQNWYESTLPQSSWHRYYKTQTARSNSSKCGGRRKQLSAR